MISAITMPALFGDKRDLTIQKFNQLEAYCGTGKGLTSYGGQPQLVEFTPQNPFARFKVSWSVRLYILYVTCCLQLRMNDSTCLCNTV